MELKNFLDDKKARITLLSIFLLGVFLIIFLSFISGVEQRYEYFSGNLDEYTRVGGEEWRSQSFTIGNVGTNETFTINSVRIYGHKEGSPGTLTAEIYAASGDEPTGSALSLGTLAEGSISSANNWNNITMSSYELQPGVKYVILLKAPTGDISSNYIAWVQHFGDAYSGGIPMYSANSGSSWSDDSAWETWFEVWGDSGDATPLTYSQNQANNSVAGLSTEFALYVDDETSLNTNGRYIFSTNNSGSWVNDSAVNFTTTPSWANVTKTLNSTGNIAVGYRWYLTDNATNVNNTPIFVLTTTDIISPTYSQNQISQTIAGQSAVFALSVNDDTALHSNGRYIFSTNNSGTWINDSAVNFTTTPSWANITKTLNSTGGLLVGYRWYLTDNSLNSNSTPIYTFVTSDTTPPSISINLPLNQTYKTSSVVFNVTATDASSVGACLYSFDNGVVNYTLTNTAGNFWTATNSSMVDEFFNVIFYCADSASNWNSTSALYFTVDTNPVISWQNPTPSDGGMVNSTYVYLNASTSDFSETSSWIDWNNSLIGYWGFDYYNSTGVFDNSSRDNFGLFNGMTSSDLVSGKRGNAADFDGTSNITITDDDSLDGMSEITIAAWVKIHSRGTFSRIVSKEFNDVVWEDDSYMLLLNGDDETAYLRLYLDDGTNPYSGYSSSVIPIETWTFLVGTYNGSRASIYHNGVEENHTDGLSGSINRSSVPVVLGNGFDGLLPLNGSVDEVMIFNRALSSTEILALYNSSQYNAENNFTGLDDGATYYYQAYSIDSVGNLNVGDNRSLEVNLSSSDVNPPTVYITSPVNGTTYAVYNVSLEVTTNENSTCYYILNGSSTNYLMDADLDWLVHEKTVTFSNGAYEATFNCSDVAGNINNTQDVYFRVNVVESVVSSPGSSSSSSSSGSSTTTFPYSLDPLSVDADVGVGTTKVQEVTITNSGSDTLNLSISEKNLGKMIILPSDFVVVEPGEEKKVEFIFVGLNDTGVFTGTIYIGSKAIPVSLNVRELNLLFDSNIVVLNKAYIIRQGDKLKTSVELIPMGDPARLDVTLNYAVKDYDGNIYLTRSESVLVQDRTKFDREFDTGILPVGKYVVALELVYPNGVAPSSAHFEVIEWIPSTPFGKIVFYILNAILVILIAIIGLVISNLVSEIRRKQ